MKRLAISLVVLGALLFPLGATATKKKKKRRPPPPCSEGTKFRNCPACGNAVAPNAVTLNVQKNRDAKATSTDQVTVADLARAKTDNAFPDNKKVSVTGYVASVVSGGFEETCNCQRDDLRDIHINIVSRKADIGNLAKYVVVEFTPRWEKKFGLDDTDYQAMIKKVRKEILNKLVKFDGWTLYDSMHVNASKSTMPQQKTCPDDGQQHPKCNWRATPWEVHPVTSFAVTSAP